MTGAEVAQLLTSLATLTGVVVSSIISLRNSSKLDTVHTMVDGLSDKRAEAAAGQATAEEKVRGLETAAEVLAANGRPLEDRSKYYADRAKALGHGKDDAK
jgi:hypothetical protein